MNRIHNPVQSGEKTSNLPAFELQATLSSPPAHDTSHALFVPLHYERNYAYPLIVWLHAPGTLGERALPEIMSSVSLRNYVAVAPRGFHAGDSDVGLGHLDWPQTEGHIDETERRVFHAVEAACQKCNVSGHRIFIAGFGSGGTMAFRMAMNHPERFAGVLSLCGGFPQGHTPLAQLTAARKLPLLLAIGRDSVEYPPERACEDLRLFHTAGMSIALRQYPSPQELSEQMLRDVDRWIIEQVSTAGDPPAAADDLWAFSSE